MMQALRNIWQRLGHFIPTTIDGKSQPSRKNRLESHKARVLFFSGLILAGGGAILLTIQLVQTIHPGITPAPAIDMVSDSISILAGVLTIHFLKKNCLRISSLIVLGLIFFVSLSLLLYGPPPRLNVPGVFSLLLFAVLAMFLLERHHAWYSFGVVSLSLIGINLLRMGDIQSELVFREPASEALFSIITWIIGGGLITLIIYTTTNVLKTQAHQLREQLHRLQDKEQKIQAGEKRYRSIFEGVHDAVLVETDQGEILDVNQRACDMFGYSYQQFLDLTVSDIVSEEGTVIDLEFLQKQGGFVENLESENIRSSGERFPVEFSAQLQHIADQQVMVFVLRDITERKEAQRALERQLKELQGLHTIAEMGTKEIDEDKIIRAATAVVEDVLHPEFHGVLTLNEGKTHLTVHPSYRNVPQKYIGATLSVQEGVSGQVARTGVSQYHPDVRNVPHYLNIIPTVRTECCLPIMTQNEIIGVLNVESTEGDAYSRGDRRLLQTLAGQLATSIERTRLFNTVNQQLSRLQSLRTIDRAISSSLDLNVTLNIILNQTLSQLEVDAACVLLLDPDSHTLQYQKGKGFTTNAIHKIYQRLGVGLGGRVAMGKDPVHVPNLTEITISRERIRLTQEEQFMFYCGLPLISKGKPQGILELYHRSSKPINKDWMEYAELLSGQAAIALDNAKLFEELQKTNLSLTQAYDSTLAGWAKALELRDHDTEGHSQRVTGLTLKLAREMGLDESQLPNIKRGALLHDIGKMAIPDHILQKEGDLTEEEWTEIKRHPEYAKQMLQNIHFLQDVMDIPVYHHERWDGSGYPQGLERENIPLSARIFAVVDVWDALTSDRPYRKAWSEEAAYHHILKQSGSHFDPQVVSAFKRVIDFKDAAAASRDQ